MSPIRKGVDRVVVRVLVTYGRLLRCTVQLRGVMPEPGPRTVWMSWHEYAFVSLLCFVVAGRNQLPLLVARDDRRSVIFQRVYAWFGGKTAHVTYGRSPRRSDSLRLDDMAGTVRQGGSCILFVDGPGGPRRIEKPGARRLAQTSGAELWRLEIAVRRKVTVPRWDRFVVPLPFSLIDVAASPAGDLAVPKPRP